MNKSTTLYYHGYCNDGVTAAVLASRVLGSEATYLPASYSYKQDYVSEGDVFFVDFYPGNDVVKSLLDKMVGTDSTLTILDHHKSALDDFDKLPDEYKHRINFNIKFDMNKCGARLASEVFGVGDSDDMNELVRLIDVRDRWVETSEEDKLKADYISAYLYQQRYNSKPIAEASMILQDVEQNLDHVLMAGKYMYEIQVTMAHDIIRNAKKVEVNGVVLGIGFTPELPSLTGSIFCREYNEGKPAIYVSVGYRTKTNTYGMSLRSNDQIDALDLVKSYKALRSNVVNGGGHPQACGLDVSCEQELTPEQVVLNLIECLTAITETNKFI